MCLEINRQISIASLILHKLLGTYECDLHIPGVGKCQRGSLLTVLFTEDIKVALEVVIECSHISNPITFDDSPPLVPILLHGSNSIQLSQLDNKQFQKTKTVFNLIFNLFTMCPLPHHAKETLASAIF